MIPLGSIMDSVYRWWAYLTAGRTFSMILGIGFAILAISLLAASRTKWGQSKPLTKCIVLSVLAHVWLLMYAYGTRIILPQGDPRGRDNGSFVAINGALLDESTIGELQPDEPESDESQSDAPWEQPAPMAELPQVESPEITLDQIAQSALMPPVATAVVTPTAMPNLPDDFFEVRIQPLRRFHPYLQLRKLPRLHKITPPSWFQALRIQSSHRPNPRLLKFQTSIAYEKRAIVFNWRCHTEPTPIAKRRSNPD